MEHKIRIDFIDKENKRAYVDEYVFDGDEVQWYVVAELDLETHRTYFMDYSAEIEGIVDEFWRKYDEDVCITK